MNEELTSYSIIDAIASIELQRQELDRVDDPHAWRAGALCRLQELLGQLQQAMQSHGADAERMAMARSVSAQIDRVKSQAGVASPRAPLKGAARHRPNSAARNALRHPETPAGQRAPRRRGGR
jgi:hypothetical protein